MPHTVLRFMRYFKKSEILGVTQLKSGNSAFFLDGVKHFFQ